MNWDDVAKTVIGLGAPILGSAFGGPLGQIAGKVLADALGVPDAKPGPIGNALARDNAAAAVLTAETRWLTALTDIGRAQVSEVGQTMRAEAVSSDLLQRWWRPLYALELTILECPAFAVALGHGLWNGTPEIINGFATLSGLLMTYMAARFGVLGVYVSGRSREKQAALTGNAVPSLIGEVVKAMMKKR
jgi:hypothetical protein